MARLCAARTEDEARGGGAADARRWTALRTPVEARAMLKTVFRTAADHAAQVQHMASLLAFDVYTRVLTGPVCLQATHRPNLPVARMC